MLNKKTFIKTGIAGLAGISLMSTMSKVFAEDQKTNIIVILADDMGYSDILSDDINTPNLDKMTQNGVMFTQFYNNAKCCPSRASLLTGSYDVRQDRNKPNFAATMQKAGYLTAMIGKVHGHSTNGFMKDFTVHTGAFDFFDPSKPSEWKVKGGKKLEPNTIQIDGEKQKDWTAPKGFYTTDDFTDYGISYINEAKKQKKPFFIYMAYNAPHWPLQAHPKDIAKYKGKYKQNLDKIRKARYKKLIKNGIIPNTNKLSPRDEKVPEWDTLSEKKKEELDTMMATHAAMIDCLDQNIGRLLKKVKDCGEEKNTLIMFLSDNGASAELENGVTPNVPIGAKDSFAGFGKRGANVSCTPFRKFKTFNHEGGISTPMIAYWPGGIKKTARIDETPAHIIDIMPTCLNIAKISKDKIQGKMDGISFLPALKNQKWKGHSEIYWKYHKAKAIRQGDWKLVSHKNATAGEWELYNIKEDRTELNNLSKKHPEKTKELKKLWDTWKKNCKKKKK